MACGSYPNLRGDLLMIRLINGDCLTELKNLEPESVHCCVTSPPYWGLRDYGVEGQLGLEKTPDEYVEKLVAVFREVRRVLADDGTLWLNLGDSYSGSMKGSGGNDPERSCKQVTNSGSYFGSQVDNARKINTGLKPKDLMGIPWRVAFALQSDGWYLRQDIIWAKPNPMPESVTDRCTKSHEYIFLLTKSAKYFYDAEAVKEPNAPATVERAKYHWCKPDTKAAQYQDMNGLNRNETYPMNEAGRNRRSVWTITTKPFKEAHFATFPEELIIPCIKAGCPKGGVVLDPFAGSGTTGVVAEKLGRDYILIELNPKYIEMADNRTWNVAPLFRTVK